MGKIKNSKNESGQVGLVVLLIGAVIMTLAIGAATQSVVGTKTARQESESSQAFNLAEQGIEEALSRSLVLIPEGQQSTSFLPDGYSGTYQVIQQVTYASSVLTGHSANIVLYDAVANVRATSPLTVSWTSAGCSGIIVTIFDATGTLRRDAYRSDTCGAGNYVDFTPAVLNSTFVSFGLTDSLMRITAVGSAINLTVSGPMPVQSFLIEATASQDSGNETRAVQATRGVPALPSLFDYSLFSGLGNITQ